MQSIISRVMSENSPPIPSHKVLGFPDRMSAEEYLLQHPDGVLGAVHFVTDSSSGGISYIVQSNSTVRDL